MSVECRTWGGLWLVLAGWLVSAPPARAEAMLVDWEQMVRWSDVIVVAELEEPEYLLASDSVTVRGEDATYSQRVKGRVLETLKGNPGGEIVVYGLQYVCPATVYAKGRALLFLKWNWDVLASANEGPQGALPVREGKVAGWEIGQAKGKDNSEESVLKQVRMLAGGAIASARPYPPREGPFWAKEHRLLGPEEMVAQADVIAVVEPEDLDMAQAETVALRPDAVLPPAWAVEGEVTEVLKGEPGERVRISAMTPGPAEHLYEWGDRYLVFLKRTGEGYETLNWKWGARPVWEGKTEWFAGPDSMALAEIPLDDLRAFIRAQLAKTARGLRDGAGAASLAP